MKLCLNLCDQDLAYHFGVRQPTVSRKWVMYTRLKPTIQWPSHEAVVKTMPSEFRSEFVYVYGRLNVGILDIRHSSFSNPWSRIKRVRIIHLPS